jgi:hypothetical protein
MSASVPAGNDCNQGQLIAMKILVALSVSHLLNDIIQGAGPGNLPTAEDGVRP